MDETPAINFFYQAFEAMRAGDLQRLEQMTHLSEFPRGIDGWLGRHWLTTAIDAGNADAVSWVLSKGAHATYVDDEGFTAIASALQLEGDSRQFGVGAAPLVPQDAAQLTIRIVDLLTDAGADINQCATLDTTALHWTARWSSPDVVRHLLAKGADPTAQDCDYGFETPVDVAAYCKRWDVHALLCDAAARAPS